MISTETYKQARQDTLKAATDLYGQCSAEYQATQAAWSAVSVTGNDQPCGGQPTTSPTDTSSPTPPPNQGCGGVSAWNASTGYEPDDEVSYNGSLWKAIWWSTGAAPGEAGSWAVWQKVGDC
jgi:hypothetical protein